MRCNEFRCSRDLNFICPSGEAYRALRNSLQQQDYATLFGSDSEIQLPREIQADEHSIHFPVVIDEIAIKFEILCEARIMLGEPVAEHWCRIPCLSHQDLCAEKLMLNADRWMDETTYSRDLLDLGQLYFKAGISPTALSKAEAAYPVMQALDDSLDRFCADGERQTLVFRALNIADQDRAMLAMNKLQDWCVNHTLLPG